MDLMAIIISKEPLSEQLTVCLTRKLSMCQAGKGSFMTNFGFTMVKVAVKDRFSPCATDCMQGAPMSNRCDLCVVFVEWLYLHVDVILN